MSHMQLLHLLLGSNSMLVRRNQQKRCTEMGKPAQLQFVHYGLLSFKTESTYELQLGGFSHFCTTCLLIATHQH